MEKTGIIELRIANIGLCRLDAGGLRLVQSYDANVADAAFVDNLLKKSFAALDGTHVTTQEAAAQLHEVLILPKEAVEILGITDDDAVLPYDPEEKAIF